MAYDRIVGSDVSGNLPPIVQNILDARIDQRAGALIPAVSPLQALIIGDGSATLPTRPATSNPVLFNTTSTPPLNGTVAGGTTGRVAGLDIWPGDYSGGGTGGSSGVLQETPLGSGNYPIRDATTESRTFRGVEQPAGGGTISGGTAQMVDGLDFWEQVVIA